jgi:RHS repeat-associated protein
MGNRLKSWIFFVLAVLALAMPAAHAQNWNAVSIDSQNLAQWDEAAAKAYEQPGADSAAPYGPKWCSPMGWQTTASQTHLQSDGHTFQRQMDAYSNCNSAEEMYGIFHVATYRVYTCVNGSRWSWFYPARAWLCQTGYYVNLQGDNPANGDCSCDQGRAATAHPIEIGTGNMSESATDFSSGDGRLRLDRYYNSNPENPMVAGRGWKNTFEARRIVSLEAMAKAMMPGSSVRFATSSGTYSSAAAACVQGVADVAQVGQGGNPPDPRYQGVTAVYLGNGKCQLSSGGVIPVLNTGVSVIFEQSVADASGGVVVLRPDGNSYTFTCANGVCQSVGQGQPSLSASASGYVLTAPNGDIESYDVDGTLQSIVSRDGYTQTLSHNTDGTVHTVTDNHGRQILFGYNVNGLLGTLILPDRTQIAYGYDSGNRLTSVTYPDAGVVRYQYTDTTFRDALTAWIDESNTTYAIWHYDPSTGKATNSALAGNVDTSALVYNGDATTLTDNLGTSRTYHFQNVAGGMRLTSIDGPVCSDCVGRTMTYDSNGYLQSVQDWLGNRTTFAFDATGLLQNRTEAVGGPEQRRTDTQWNPVFRVPLSRTVSDADGNLASSEQWIYNTRGQPLAHCEIDPAKAKGYVCSVGGLAPEGVRRWVYSYCDSVGDGCPLVGLMLTTTGPRTDLGQTTTYSYYTSSSAVDCGTSGSACYQAGDLYRVTNALGQYTTYVSYDADGRVTRMTDPNGVNIDMTYTPRGWLATRSVGGATTAFGYTPYGAVSSVRDPDGVTTTFAYDAAHRLTDIVDANGNRLHYALDGAGNRTQEEVIRADATVVRSMANAYDALGHLTAITDGLGRTVFSASAADSYDGNGNLVHSEDGLGHQTKQAFDGLNRLVSTLKDYQGTDAATANSQTVRSFDALDRVVGFSDPDGLNTTYDFDGLGNARGTQSPDTGLTTRSFDIAGNAVTSVDALGTTRSMTYDADNRPLAVTFANASDNYSYKYDESDAVTGCTGGHGAGRLTSIVEAGGGITWCYDGRGNVVKKVQVIGGASRVTSYAWTNGDRLKSLTTPNGTTITYARNTLGQITGVTATPMGGVASVVVSNVTYQPFGPVASVTWGNGLTATYTYDQTGALTDITGDAFTQHLRRDVSGNVVALGDSAGVPVATETYGYDPLYRLTSVNGASGSAIEAYTYNQAGDRLSKAAPGMLTGSYTYAPGTHHLTGVGTTTRVVDARGNTTANALASGSYVYGYNDRNRMTSVQKDGATLATYSLNALGLRVQKTAGGQATLFDYNEDSQLISEASGSSQRDYVWLDGMPVGVVDGYGAFSSVAFVAADGLGTPRAVTNSAGSVLWQWAFAGNPFGEVAPTSLVAYLLNLRFSGQYFDAESGLAYNVHRDYESATGRYIQSDPIGLLGGISTYAYVSGHPLSRTDPLGLAVKCVVVLKLPFHDIQACQEDGSQPSPQDARDAKRMKPKSLDEACRANGYEDAHAMKRDLQLGSDRDIFADGNGNMYSGPRQGTGEMEYLHMNVDGWK